MVSCTYYLQCTVHSTLDVLNVLDARSFRRHLQLEREQSQQRSGSNMIRIVYSIILRVNHLFYFTSSYTLPLFLYFSEWMRDQILQCLSALAHRKTGQHVTRHLCAKYGFSIRSFYNIECVCCIVSPYLKQLFASCSILITPTWSNVKFSYKTTNTKKK